MARRRMISEHMIFDEEFNSLSVAAQNVFLRLLAKSDDCGVVPANLKVLAHLINCPTEINGQLSETLEEIVKSGLGSFFEFKGKRFFCFKDSSFKRHQSYIINRRLSSEYLKISAKEFDQLMLSCQSIDKQSEVSCGSTDIESRKQKAESNKQKAESSKQ